MDNLVDQERLIKDFTCPVCNLVPRQGSLLFCCLGHNICQGCFEELRAGSEDDDNDDVDNSRSCPQCKARYIILEGGLPQRNFTADAFLDRLPLKCRNRDNGCRVGNTRANLAMHEAVCDFAKRPCQYAARGCPQVILASQLEQHEKICPCRVVQCKNARHGCEEYYSPTEESRHLVGCHFQPVRCVYHDTCLERVPLSRMASHLTEIHEVEMGEGKICTLNIDLAGTEGKVLGGVLMKNGEKSIFVFIWHHKDSYRAIMSLLAPPREAKGMIGKVTMFRPDDKVLVNYSGPVNDISMWTRRAFDQLSGLNLTKDFVKKSFKRANSLEIKFEFELMPDPDSATEEISEHSFMMQLQEMSAQLDAQRAAMEEKDRMINRLMRKEYVPLLGSTARSNSEVEKLRMAVQDLRNSKLRKQATDDLWIAAAEGKCDKIKSALDRGADVFCREFQSGSILHTSAWGGKAEAIRLLVAHHADVNAQDNRGNTPLHSAAYCGQMTAAQSLLEMGARHQVLNLRGQTAMALALERKNYGVAQILQDVAMNLIQP